jgi:hypothetical protein
VFPGDLLRALNATAVHCVSMTVPLGPLRQEMQGTQADAPTAHCVHVAQPNGVIACCERDCPPTFPQYFTVRAKWNNTIHGHNRSGGLALFCPSGRGWALVKRQEAALGRETCPLTSTTHGLSLRHSVLKDPWMHNTICVRSEVRGVSSRTWRKPQAKRPAPKMRWCFRLPSLKTRSPLRSSPSTASSPLTVLPFLKLVSPGEEPCLARDPILEPSLLQVVEACIIKSEAVAISMSFGQQPCGVGGPSAPSQSL